jgi:hypothetical protein
MDSSLHHHSRIKGRLRVSSNRRFLVHEDGSPFFWLGDTAWELFHRLSKSDVRYYLKNRADKGFNVVQAVALAELDGLQTPNAEGEIPLHNLDPRTPNEKYFVHIDWVIQEAASLGIYIALLPTWGDKVQKEYEWAAGPEVFDINNAYYYGYYLGRRYQHTDNLIWILGGDRTWDINGVAIWRSMAAGIISGSGGKDKTLMSLHTTPMNGGSSSQWFHHDEWLDFNLLQTGHDKHKATYDLIAADYNRFPTKPVIDGEPTYEAHALSFKIDNGYSTAHEVRKFAYWSLFAGSFGHTYGCHSVWQFYTKERIGINAPIYEWKDALDLEGAQQMIHLKKLLCSRNILERIPDHTLIERIRESPERYCAATRCKNGTYAWVYTPYGDGIDLRTAALSGDELVYRWFNPRDGSYTIPIVIERKTILHFRPPQTGIDWILVVDSQQ